MRLTADASMRPVRRFRVTPRSISRSTYLHVARVDALDCGLKEIAGEGITAPVIMAERNYVDRMRYSQYWYRYIPFQTTLLSIPSLSFSGAIYHRPWVRRRRRPLATWIRISNSSWIGYSMAPHCLSIASWREAPQERMPTSIS